MTSLLNCKLLAKKDKKDNFNIENNNYLTNYKYHIDIILVELTGTCSKVYVL